MRYASLVDANNMTTGDWGEGWWDWYDIFCDLRWEAREARGMVVPDYMKNMILSAKVSGSDRYLIRTR